MSDLQANPPFRWEGPTSLPESCFALYEKNLAILRKRFPHRHCLPDRFQGQRSAATTIPSATGHPMLVVFDRYEQALALDEFKDPRAADNAWYDRLDRTHHKNALLLGFGLGHLAERLIRDIDQFERLVILEPRADILMAAMATYDLAPLLENEKVHYWNPEDAYEASDWIAEFQEEDCDTVWNFSVFLHPRFAQASPDFLWRLSCRLAEDDERIRNKTQFLGMPDAVAKRFQAPENWSEAWAELLRLKGIKSLQGKLEGETVILLAGTTLTGAEKEFLQSAKNLPIFRGPRGHSLCERPPSLLLCGEKETVPSPVSPETLVVAEAGAFTRASFPADSIVYWTERGPARRMILPRYNTAQLLQERGQLPQSTSPVPAGLALAEVLGIHRVIMIGSPEGNTASQEAQLAELEAQRWVSRFPGQIVQIEMEGSRHRTPPVSLKEALGWDSKSVPSNLKERLDATRKSSSELRKPLSSIDRSLKGTGKTLLDERGRLKSGDGNDVLEAIFAHNLSALKKHRPAIAKMVEERLQSQSGVEVFQLGSTTAGYPLLRVIGEQGPLISAPLRPDAWEEVSEARLWEKVNTRCGNIFLGLGLGFHLEACLERTELCFILWEPSPDRLLAAMHVRNLEPLFASPRVSWYVGYTPTEMVGRILNDHLSDAFRHPPFWLPLMEPSVRKANEGIANSFLEEVQLRDPDIRSGRAGFEHILHTRSTRYFRNTLRSAEAVPLGNLSGKFEGVPAIVVAAGPSLEVTAPMLDQVQDRALIFVVDTAFRYVQPRDYDRHFIVTIDPKDETALHFKDRKPRPRDILIATSGTPEEVWDLFEGTKLLGNFGSPLLKWLGELTGIKIYPFWGGGSVAISSVGIAHEMGCSPIILTGQDLAVLPDRTHASDTIYPSRSEQDPRMEEIEIPAKGGGTVRTTPPLLAILRNLETRIALHGLDVINATAFGARIRGTREMSFEEVLAQLPDRKVSLPEIIESGKGRPFSSRKEAFKKALGDWRKELEEARRLALWHASRMQEKREDIRANRFQGNARQEAEAIPLSLLEVGIQSPRLQKMMDFFFRQALRYMDYEQRIQEAPNDRTRLLWEIDRTLPFLSEINQSVGGVLTEIDKLLEQVERQ